MTAKYVPQGPRGINESVRRNIEFERKQARKIKQLCSGPKRRLLTHRVKEASGIGPYPRLPFSRYYLQ